MSLSYLRLSLCPLATDNFNYSKKTKKFKNLLHLIGKIESILSKYDATYILFELSGIITNVDIQRKKFYQKSDSFVAGLKGRSEIHFLHYQKLD